MLAQLSTLQTHRIRLIAASHAPTPRRVRAPKWLDLRLVAGVVLVLASVLLGARVISSANASDSVWAASRDLAPGTVLSAADLSEVHVRLPAGADAYLPVHTAVLGQSVTRQVTAGELLPRAALAATDAATTITVPLASTSAPHVQRGQRVQLWVSTRSCSAIAVLADVTVQDVQSTGAGAFSSGSTQGVVIRVPAPLAGRVITALALDGAVIRAGILSGAAATSDPNDDLPPLDSCAKKP
jgi:flagella basal body P-ring formation protein FlgA